MYWSEIKVFHGESQTFPVKCTCTRKEQKLKAKCAFALKSTNLCMERQTLNFPWASGIGAQEDPRALL